MNMHTLKISFPTLIVSHGVLGASRYSPSQPVACCASATAPPSLLFSSLPFPSLPFPWPPSSIKPATSRPGGRCSEFECNHTDMRAALPSKTYSKPLPRTLTPGRIKRNSSHRAALLVTLGLSIPLQITPARNTSRQALAIATTSTHK